jgi:hypothetical protein
MVLKNKLPENNREIFSPAKKPAMKEALWWPLSKYEVMDIHIILAEH